jgi:cytochrome b pre-mRNA-processing protein 3
MLNLLRKSAARKKEGAGLYDGLVSRAREAVFFRDFRVADSIDGRFDLLVFHAWMVLTELKAQGAEDAAQGLTDTLFTGFDSAMREQGAGDMGLGRKMKSFANAFFGRLAAYEQAGNGGELAAALAKNLWRGAEPDARAQVLAAYSLSARQSLRASLPGGLDFGPLPSI